MLKPCHRYPAARNEACLDAPTTDRPSLPPVIATSSTGSAARSSSFPALVRPFNLPGVGHRLALPKEHRSVRIILEPEFNSG
jgi:hypothetical protein